MGFGEWLGFGGRFRHGQQFRLGRRLGIGQRRIGLSPLADATVRLWHWGRYGYGWEDAGADVARYRSYNYRLGGR